GAGVERRLIAPDAVHQLLPGKDAARVAREEVEEVELLRGQAQRLPVPAHLARRRVDLQRIEREVLALCARPFGPSKHPPNPCCELAGGEGLGDRKSTRLNSSHDQISYAVF